MTTEPELVRVIVVSEGRGAEWLRSHAAVLDLDNLLILPFQPMERYSEVLGTGDVLVAILEDEAGTFSVPSKVLSYLCAQRPLLLAVPENNLAARLVKGKSAGIVTAPGDSEAIIQAAHKFISSPDTCDMMARNARQYAQRSFDISHIADRFESLVSKQQAHA